MCASSLRTASPRWHGVDQGPATGNPRLPVLKLVARLTVWHLLPNGRRTSFFNMWAGRRRPDRYWAEVRDDLGHVLDLLARREITAQVAASFPLSQAGAALSYAEAGGYTGKVIIVPDADRAPGTAT